MEKRKWHEEYHMTAIQIKEELLTNKQTGILKMKIKSK